MSSATIRSLAVRASAALAVAALAACSTETVPTGPGVNLRDPAKTVIIGDASNSGTGNIRLCKWSDVAGVPYNFTITKVSGGGTLELSGAQQITPNTPLLGNGGAEFPAEYLPYKYEGCITILNTTAAGVTTVSVTETVQNGVTLGVLTGSGNATTFVTDQPTAKTTIGVSNVQAATIYFKNSGTPEEELDGCTYTQGYWKTHSSSGPAKKTDPTWASALSSAQNTVFLGLDGSSSKPFGATKTWLQLFNTPPKGDAAIILAHQFMAAYLNTQQTNGADMSPTVQTAYDTALSYFKGNISQTKAQLTALAGILGAYNEGQMGTPHCGQESQI